jgi:uncharacterized protein YndB with AHSA1/START domain
MPARNETAGVATKPQVLITRTFDARRDVVFGAWTDPTQLPRWFAPQGCSIRFLKLDIRTGGEFHSCITTPTGHECWCRGVYREVSAPDRIVLTMAIADANGKLISAAEAGMHEDWPRETIVTVTFAESQGKTTITLRQTVSEALAKQTGAHPSWLMMFDRLADVLRAG